MGLSYHHTVLEAARRTAPPEPADTPGLESQGRLDT
jgi:hypothetical protein